MGLPVIILGAGGHAKVLIDALIKASDPIIGIVDINEDIIGETIIGISVIGGESEILRHKPCQVRLINGIGSVGKPQRRVDVFNRFKNMGYDFAPIIHRAAIISDEVHFAEGVQVMAGAVIQPGCSFGVNAIINTGALVDHDCVIGNHVHIAPGVTVSGGVSIGDRTHVGTGATVIQGIHIGHDCTIGAGALVIRDVTPGATVVGVPAREVRA